MYNHYYKPSFLLSAFRLGGGTSVESSFGRLLTIETANNKIVVYNYFNTAGIISANMKHVSKSTIIINYSLLIQYLQIFIPSSTLLISVNILTSVSSDSIVQASLIII